MRLKSALTSLLVFLLVAPFPVLSQNRKELSGDKDHRGLVRLRGGKYYVFPEGRRGNGIYKKRELLFSSPDLILVDLIEVPGGHLYYGKDKRRKPLVGYLGEEENTLKKFDFNYFQLTTVQGHKKLYRINSNNLLQDLLPTALSGNGLVTGRNGSAAFFHIYSGEPAQGEEKNKWTYTFHVHVVRPKELKRQLAASNVQDSRPFLKLSWVNNKTLEYRLSNGEKARLEIP